MGEFRFYYPRRALDPTLAQYAFIARRMRAPAVTETRVERCSETRDMLVLRTRSDEAGVLYVPFIDAHGCFFFASTETLSPSETPRPLYLELARGQLSRLFNKSCDWLMRGFVPSINLRVSSRNAIRRFTRLCIADKNDPNFDDRSFDFFKSLCTLSAQVNEQYLSRVLTVRGDLSSRWVTRFGFSGPVDSSWPELYDSVFVPQGGKARPKIDPIFQTLNPDFYWANIEHDDGDYNWFPFDAAMGHAESRNLSTTIGPLIRWGEMPPRFIDDRPEQEVRQYFKRYVSKLLERDGKRAKRWIVATNVESKVEGTTIETRLVLAAQLAFEIKRQHPKAQAFLGFDQPFGDSSRCIVQDMTPLELAMRVASRRVFDGFYLEVNFGLSDNATYPRDPMELHRFFDRWCALGVPICLGLSCPSAELPTHIPEESSTVVVDPNKTHPVKRGDRPSSNVNESDSDLLSDSSNGEDATAPPAIWHEEMQRETMRRFITSALSHRNVDEIIFTKFADSLEYGSDILNEENDDEDEKTNPFIMKSVLAEETFLDSERNEIIELVQKESKLGRYNPRDRNRFPTSGLFDETGAPKSTLHKLSAIRRAYID